MPSSQGKIKKAKYEDRILNELNLILRSQVSDSRLQFVSLTKVELTNDFSEAKVYWDTFDAGKRGDIKKALASSAGKLRSLLANAMKVRHTPQLTLLYDSQYESEKAISDILDAEAKDGKNF